MSKTKAVACVLVLGMAMAVSSLAQAQAQAQTRPASIEGAYVGLGVGIGSFNLKKNDFAGTGATTRSFDERDKAFKLFGGYRFNDHLAVEGQVARLGESSIRYRGAAGALGNETYKVTAVSATAMGLLPLGKDFTLFAKAGPSYTRAESSFSNRALGANTKSSRAGALVGVGASYALTDNLSLRAEAESFLRVGEAAKAGRSSVQVLSAGLAYRF
jgi:OmpA-OmpF porin, OOP family